MKHVLFGLIIRLLPIFFAIAAIWWRVESPVASYATLMGFSQTIVSNITLFLDQNFGWNFMSSTIQKVLNLVLVDQFNGVMIGLIIRSVFSLIWWILFSPARAVGSLFKKKKKS